MSETEETPLFLVGTGRSGTTIVYSCLAMHPDLAWVSSWVGMAPRLPMAVFNRFWDLPGTDRFREKRFFPRPAEPMRIFPRKMTAYRREDVSEETLRDAREHLVPLLRRIRRQQGKPRFLTKMAGRPVKSELLARVFPRAFILHITRDLKPTVASLLQVHFYDRSSGLDPWPWGSIPGLYREFYERTGKSAEVAAAIKVRLNRIEQDRQLGTIAPSQWLELPYAAFVEKPLDWMREIGERTGLKMDDRFLHRVQAKDIYGGADNKWKRQFTTQQIGYLEEFESLPSIDPLDPSAPG